ncbi:MAG: hypothetical protein NC254_06720 [bacterium]|nr:hypothetical protein [bacterium]
MKRTLKKWLVTLLSAVMVFSSLTITAAAEGEEYELYVGFGGDAAESGDWGYQFNSPNADNNAGDITAVTETIKVGETKTVSLTVPSEVIYTWWIAPVIVAEGVTDLSADVQVSIDGNDVTGDVDFSAGDAWWYEGTGAYDETQAIRLAGGYNEWGTHYLEAPVFTTIEYTITLNSLTVGGGDDAAAGEPVELTGPFELYVGFGGDAAESGDWGFQFNSPNADNNAGDITAVTESISVGETKTVSLTLPNEAVYTWWLAPVIVAEGVTDLSADVQVSIDGNDVTGDVDFSAGDAWWYEGTGAYDETQAIRLAGGYNEWGTHYMESPVFTTIEYTITLNSVMAGGAAPAEEEPEEEASAVGAVDLGGTYNAYLGFQTPKFSFRNACDDGSYGRDVEADMDYFHQVTGWDGNDAVTLPGTFTDAVIAGNGTYTVSVDGLSFPDGEFADQEYMNLIFLSTDIPNTGEITISDVKLSVNGSSVDLPNGALLSPDSESVINMLLQNIWNDDVKEVGYYAVPPTSMSITFTVSGFNYDAEAPAEEPSGDTSSDATPIDDTTPAPAEETTSTDTEKSGSNVVVIVVIVVVVVVAAAVAGVVVAKKKKK